MTGFGRGAAANELWNAAVEISSVNRKQAEVVVQASADDLALLHSLGDDLKFVMITSAAQAVAGAELGVQVVPSTHQKCERCWHYETDIGQHSAHPSLCGRCVAVLS